MIQPKNNVYSDIFFLSLGKLTIAMIVYKFNSEIGRLLVIYYVDNMNKNGCVRFRLDILEVFASFSAIGSLIISAKVK